MDISDSVQTTTSVSCGKDIICPSPKRSKTDSTVSGSTVDYLHIKECFAINNPKHYLSIPLQAQLQNGEYNKWCMAQHSPQEEEQWNTQVANTTKQPPHEIKLLIESHVFLNKEKHIAENIRSEETYHISTQSFTVCPHQFPVLVNAIEVDQTPRYEELITGLCACNNAPTDAEEHWKESENEQNPLSKIFSSYLPHKEDHAMDATECLLDDFSVEACLIEELKVNLSYEPEMELLESRSMVDVTINVLDPGETNSYPRQTNECFHTFSNDVKRVDCVVEDGVPGLSDKVSEFHNYSLPNVEVGATLKCNSTENEPRMCGFFEVRTVQPFSPGIKGNPSGILVKNALLLNEIGLVGNSADLDMVEGVNANVCNMDRKAPAESCCCYPDESIRTEMVEYVDVAFVSNDAVLSKNLASNAAQKDVEIKHDILKAELESSDECCGNLTKEGLWRNSLDPADIIDVPTIIKTQACNETDRMERVRSIPLGCNMFMAGGQCSSPVKESSLEGRLGFSGVEIELEQILNSSSLSDAIGTSPRKINGEEHIQKPSAASDNKIHTGNGENSTIRTIFIKTEKERIHCVTDVFHHNEEELHKEVQHQMADLARSSYVIRKSKDALTTHYIHDFDAVTDNRDMEVLSDQEFNLTNDLTIARKSFDGPSQNTLQAYSPHKSLNESELKSRPNKNINSKTPPFSEIEKTEQYPLETADLKLDTAGLLGREHDQFCYMLTLSQKQHGIHRKEETIESSLQSVSHNNSKLLNTICSSDFSSKTASARVLAYEKETDVINSDNLNGCTEEKEKKSTGMNNVSDCKSYLPAEDMLNSSEGIDTMDETKNKHGLSSTAVPLENQVEETTSHTDTLKSCDAIVPDSEWSNYNANIPVESRWDTFLRNHQILPSLSSACVPAVVFDSFEKIPISFGTEESEIIAFTEYFPGRSFTCNSLCINSQLHSDKLEIEPSKTATELNFDFSINNKQHSEEQCAPKEATLIEDSKPSQITLKENTSGFSEELENGSCSIPAPAECEGSMQHPSNTFEQDVGCFSECPSTKTKVHSVCFPAVPGVSPQTLGNACGSRYEMKKYFDLVLKELKLFFEIGKDIEQPSSPADCETIENPLQEQKNPPVYYFSSSTVKADKSTSRSEDFLMVKTVIGTSPATRAREKGDCEQEVPLLCSLSDTEREESLYSALKNRVTKDSGYGSWTPAFTSPHSLHDNNSRLHEQFNTVRLEPLKTCTRPIRIGLSKRARPKQLHPYLK